MIKAIEKFIADMKKPNVCSPEYYFRFESYSQWASREVLNYVLIHDELSPIEAVEQYMDKMKEYASRDHNDNTNDIFRIAYDVSSEIRDLLLCINSYDYSVSWYQ